MVGNMRAKIITLRNEDCFALEQRMETCPEITEALVKQERKRLFCNGRTFWLFLWQVLSADRSCSEVVQAFLAWLALSQDKQASPNTAAYCKARKRLNFEAIQTVLHTLAAHMEQRIQQGQLWYGRRVKVVDGTGISMPDTPENQKQYPQSKSSKPGCGFPEMRLVAMFCLSTGTLLRHAISSRKIGELTLFRRLWNTLQSKDVVLADRGFCNYADFYRLMQRNVDSVMRLHQRRTKGLRRLKRLATGDEIMLWYKSKPAPKGLTKKQWATFPDTLIVRHITFVPSVPGFRTKKITIATTMIDHKQFPATAFAELYRRRWMVELFLRDIKITLGMDILRCKTPDMIEKELTMHLIAYNLIRHVMQQAATKAEIKVERISFKGTLQAIRQWAPNINHAAALEQRQQLYESMLIAISRVPIPNRLNRNEPRVRKRRPKNYQLMSKPRHEMKDILHRSRYKKEK